MTRQSDLTERELIEEKVEPRNIWIAQSKLNPNNEDMQWEVRKEEADRATKDFRTREDAWEHAKDLARENATHPKPAGARLKKMSDGQFAENRFYPHPNQKDNDSETQSSSQRVGVILTEDSKYGEAGHMAKMDEQEAAFKTELITVEEFERTVLSKVPSEVYWDYLEGRATEVAELYIDMKMGEDRVVIVVEDGYWYMVGGTVMNFTQENSESAFRKKNNYAHENYGEALTDFQSLPALKTESQYVLGSALKEFYEWALEKQADTEEDVDMTTEEAYDIEKEILNAVEKHDNGDGAEVSKVLNEVDYERARITKGVNNLLSEGTLYEPRPDHLKKL